MMNRPGQRGIIEGFGDERRCVGAVSRKPISVPGNQNDWNRWLPGAQPLAQVEAAHARQSHIDNDAIDRVGLGLEILGRRKHAHRMTHCTEQADKRRTHVFVIVHDREPQRGHGYTPEYR